jgi:hypothetical protein
MNPPQVILTSWELVSDSPGGIYRDSIESILSSGSMRGLLSETSDSHS